MADLLGPQTASTGDRLMGHPPPACRLVCSGLFEAAPQAASLLRPDQPRVLWALWGPAEDPV